MFYAFRNSLWTGIPRILTIPRYPSHYESDGDRSILVFIARDRLVVYITEKSHARLELSTANMFIQCLVEAKNRWNI